MLDGFDEEEFLQQEQGRLLDKNVQMSLDEAKAEIARLE